MKKEPYFPNIAPILPGHEEELADAAAGWGRRPGSCGERGGL